MTEFGKPERFTQNRIIQLFQEELGYKYLGNWEDREGNSNIEESLLTKFLLKQGYDSLSIERAIYELKTSGNKSTNSLYANNKATYHLIRYGINVKTEAGKNFTNVPIIDWEDPLNNDFYLAEEVTISGNREKRPDIVIYINGIAIGVLELKRSTVSINDGIRQSLVNQQAEFIQSFFTTVQFIFAGNDTEGLKYGTIGTPEKYFLKWKEDEDDNSRLILDKYLIKICNKERFIELIHDFVLFDGGQKKLPRVHQYFGIKAAQKHINRYEGGIIWHTQGSGKSIVMVLLAKWILENNPKARVIILTDRDELDKQIERVFIDADEKIHRTSSGDDLMEKLAKASPRLICTLIHKFRRGETEDFSQFIQELESQSSKAIGELFVFVDECHRTQSGRLHRTMKAILPSAVFIGFTGTPLLKLDKQTSNEVFGKYIHTYKFNEGVYDKVILDLVYEARDIDQRLSSQTKIDEWFDIKTRGLNDFQKSELKKKWGTMQKVLSSKSRMSKIVSDIVFDFNTKERLTSKKGNAILVASSIPEACKYYEIFLSTELKNKCAIITSYNPQTRDITLEDTGTNTETEKEFIYKLYTDILKDVQVQAGKSQTETYEDWAKKMFREEPANMKLLIVVSKLLTGFDAPPCSYLYIDKSLQDHGLFQAICRVNRLDGEDKMFGYIIDYKDLFKKVEDAVSVYTSELDYDEFGKKEVDILLQDRLKIGKQKLDEALEEIALLCEPVPNPRDIMAFIRFFCGNSEIAEDLKAKEPLRNSLYKQTVSLIRAYANIADEMDRAGYSPKEVQYINKEIDAYLKLREEIRKASGESLDMKTYEADMRHLIDTYIQAEDSVKISPFDDIPILEIIEKLGVEEAIETFPTGIKKNQTAVAETVENNVRRKIIKEHLIDPAFFESMSVLLDEIIKLRKNKAISYEEYLVKISLLIKQVQEGKPDGTPDRIRTSAQKAFYNNFGKNPELALIVDQAIKQSKLDSFRGNRSKELLIKEAIYKALQKFTNNTETITLEDPAVSYGLIETTERIFKIAFEQKEY